MQHSVVRPVRVYAFDTNRGNRVQLALDETPQCVRGARQVSPESGRAVSQTDGPGGIYFRGTIITPRTRNNAQPVITKSKEGPGHQEAPRTRNNARYAGEWFRTWSFVRHDILDGRSISSLSSPKARRTRDIRRRPTNKRFARMTRSDGDSNTRASTDLHIRLVSDFCSVV